MKYGVYTQGHPKIISDNFEYAKKYLLNNKKVNSTSSKFVLACFATHGDKK